MGTQKPAKENSVSESLRSDRSSNKIKYEVFGEEMMAKEVKPSGNGGRVYLPPNWIGKHLKIIRID